jgi:3-hydroxyisobutyrate dehydrogenase-like beta-hydroxyacid dehydrogenase
MPEPPMFSANMMQKDVMLALDLAREVQVTLPTGAVVNEFLSTAREQGLGEQDFAILYKVLARMSGIA